MMEVLNLKSQIDERGYLNLDLPTSLPPGEIELVLVLNPIKQRESKRKYDFSDLIGKLNWKGDAVAVQNSFRHDQ